MGPSIILPAEFLGVIVIVKESLGVDGLLILANCIIFVNAGMLTALLTVYVIVCPVAVKPLAAIVPPEHLYWLIRCTLALIHSLRTAKSPFK